MKELEFIKQFSANNRGILSMEGEVYILVSYCKEFIRTAFNEDFAIIGIEGFYIANNSTQPIISEICDFSEPTDGDWNIYKENRVNASGMFFDEMYQIGKSNYYCFTLLAYDEYFELLLKKQNYPIQTSKPYTH